jgi:tetratricopeptide (TPR) repeat protein
MKQELLSSVLVVEPRVDLRGIIRDVVRAINKEAKVILVGSTSEAFDILGREYANINWIIGSIDLSSRFNTATLLAQVLYHPQLSHIRSTILYFEEEKHMLPVFFDLGAVSCHLKPTTQGRLISELQEMKQAFTEQKGNVALAAAKYLRNVLGSQSKFQDLIDLENRLIRMFPHHPELLLNLADAYFLAEKPEETKRILLQVRSHPDFARLEIGYKQFADLVDLKEEEHLPFAKLMGLKSLVVVDTDEQYANMVEEVAKDLGFVEITKFGLAAEAYKHIIANPPSLIICDWRQRGMSGVSFLQKTMTGVKNFIPVILFTGQVKEADGPILQDLNVTGLIEKPKNHNFLAAELMGLIAKEFDSGNLKAQKRKFYKALQAKDRKALNSILQEVSVSLSAQTEPLANQMQAELFLLDQKLIDAKNAAMRALIKGEQNLEVIHLLGKIFMQLGDHQAATQFLEKANQISPVNLERLCLLSEAKAESNDHSKAQDLLERAKKIDSSSDLVKQAEITLHLQVADVEEASQVMGRMGSLDRIIANMNNKAILLAKNGKFEEAISYYDKTIASVPKDRKKERAVLLFNKCLALVKEGNLDRSEKSLKELVALRQGNLSERAEFILQQVQKAQKLGKKVNIVSQMKPRGELSQSRPISLYASPGVLALHAIYDCGLFGDAAVANLFKDEPRLKIQIAGAQEIIVMDRNVS